TRLQLAHDLVRKPRACAPYIVEFAVAPIAEQQRTDRLARAFAAGVAADHELRRIHSLDLAPGGRATPGLVRAVAALGDDPFETAVERSRVQRLGVLRGMNELQMSRGQQALREIATSRLVRIVPEIQASEMQQ